MTECLAIPPHIQTSLNEIPEAILSSLGSRPWRYPSNPYGRGSSTKYSSTLTAQCSIDGSKMHFDSTCKSLFEQECCKRICFGAAHRKLEAKVKRTGTFDPSKSPPCHGASHVTQKARPINPVWRGWRHILPNQKQLEEQDIQDCK